MDLPQTTMEELLGQYRGEVAALEAYEPALAKFSGQREELVLRRIQGEHRAAVRRLAAVIRRHGEVVPEGSGAWGALASTIESLAGLVNDGAPLKVLHRGEEIGREGYTRLLADPALPEYLRVVLTELAERCEHHEEALARLLQDLSTAPTRPLL